MSLIHPQMPCKFLQIPASSSWQGKYSRFSDFSLFYLVFGLTEIESATPVQYMPCFAVGLYSASLRQWQSYCSLSAREHSVPYSVMPIEEGCNRRLTCRNIIQSERESTKIGGKAKQDWRAKYKQQEIVLELTGDWPKWGNLKQTIKNSPRL